MRNRVYYLRLAVLAALVALVSISAALADISVVLQEGLDGYAGTTDAYLRGRSGYADRNFGGNSVLFVGAEVTPTDFRSLIRFDLASLVAPEQYSFAKAELSLFENATAGAASLTMDVFRMDGAWVEGNSNNAVEIGAVCANYRAYNTVPWSNTADNGMLGDFYDRDASGLNERDSPYATLAVDNVNGWKTWDVTDLVTQWLNGTYENQGFLILSQDAAAGTSRRFYNSEYTSVPDRRPKLTLTYVPEPASLLALALGLPLAFMRRRSA